MKNIITTYGFIGTIQLIYFKLRTVLFHNQSRLIRFPITIRGKKFIDFGSSLTTGVGCRFEAYNSVNKSLIFGKNVQMNDYVHITAMNRVLIGDNVLMASKIYISDCTHGIYSGGVNESSPVENPIDRVYDLSEVIIEDNVWIGEFVSILPGVKIGKGSIIGANTVVTKSIPENCIAIGAPAKIIKSYNFDLKRWISVKKCSI